MKSVGEWWDWNCRSLTSSSCETWQATRRPGDLYKCEAPADTRRTGRQHKSGTERRQGTRLENQLTFDVWMRVWFFSWGRSGGMWHVALAVWMVELERKQTVDSDGTIEDCGRRTGRKALIFDVGLGCLVAFSSLCRCWCCCAGLRLVGQCVSRQCLALRPRVMRVVVLPGISFRPTALKNFVIWKRDASTIVDGA